MTNKAKVGSECTVFLKKSKEHLLVIFKAIYDEGYNVNVFQSDFFIFPREEYFPLDFFNFVISKIRTGITYTYIMLIYVHVAHVVRIQVHTETKVKILLPILDW